MTRDSDAIIKEMRRPGLLNDIMFKIVFGTQQGVPVLIELINALLDLREGDEITGLELLRPAAEKEFWVDKGPVLDLKARDQKGQQYNIEVQLRAGLDDYIKRSVYYTTRFYSEQLEAGHRYNELKRTVSISLLDFILFDREELHSQFVLWEREQGFQLCTDLELHYIELRKFVPDSPEQLQTRVQKWLYTLKFADIYYNQDLPDNLAQEEGISMAIDSMRKAYARDDVRWRIEAQEKAERDELSRISYAEQQGERRSLKIFLEARFGPLPATLSEKLDGLAPDRLSNLLPLAATAATLEEFTAGLSADP